VVNLAKTPGKEIPLMTVQRARGVRVNFLKNNRVIHLCLRKFTLTPRALPERVPANSD
jgi:hypothetical protein